MAYDGPSVTIRPEDVEVRWAVEGTTDGPNALPGIRIARIPELVRELRDARARAAVSTAIADARLKDLDAAREEIVAGDLLIKDFTALLDEFPCPAHGRCIPHVAEGMRAHAALVAGKAGAPHAPGVTGAVVPESTASEGVMGSPRPRVTPKESTTDAAPAWTPQEPTTARIMREQAELHERARVAGFRRGPVAKVHADPAIFGPEERARLEALGGKLVREAFLSTAIRELARDLGTVYVAPYSTGWIKAIEIRLQDLVDQARRVERG